MPIVIAVDAMGGDRAPGVVVEGAIRALNRLDAELLLVGPADRLTAELRHHPTPHAGRLTIVDADEVVLMDESPLAAFRRKPRSSIRIAADLVATGRAAALFSAGHSGATVMAAHSALGMLPGIERPALAVIVPTLTGAAVLLDAGATLECRPSHLVQFADMGAEYAAASLAIDRPRVGLLSIGEEAAKGNDLIRETHARLRDSGLAFIGNVEARDLFSGRADVIVCDGFTGNVALKIGEGLVEAIERMLGDELDRAVASEVGTWLTRRAFDRFRQRVDSSEYGAAPLLGVGRLVLVGHGRSTARAVENGIAFTARLAAHGTVDRVAAGLAAAQVARAGRLC